MARRKAKKTWSTTKKIIVGVLLGAAGWAIYNFVTRNSADALSAYGIADPNLQDIIMIMAFITIAALLAKKGWLDTASKAP